MFVVALCCGMLLAVASPALADQNPAQNAYGPSSINDLSQVQSASRTLPFTGINAGTVALIGFVLLGSGVAVRLQMRSRLDS